MAGRPVAAGPAGVAGGGEELQQEASGGRGKHQKVGAGAARPAAVRSGGGSSTASVGDVSGGGRRELPMKIMGLGEWVRSLRLKGRANTYSEMNMCEEAVEERRHQIAQMMINKILKQADRPKPKPALRISGWRSGGIPVVGRWLAGKRGRWGDGPEVSGDREAGCSSSGDRAQAKGPQAAGGRGLGAVSTGAAEAAGGVAAEGRGGRRPGRFGLVAGARSR
ncbi:uncharacterized protein LOC131876656 [Cryptomeria japonica]|uniref:uncharacterized protein LOC131876656 n=1 Tax=Cryptomeria japonica TaxID=3369 RepID=UPI0027DAB0F8|nr:uncharacterized protein LOC131876656 [Cryptomeria japonica]